MIACFLALSAIGLVANKHQDSVDVPSQLNATTNATSAAAPTPKLRGPSVVTSRIQDMHSLVEKQVDDLKQHTFRTNRGHGDDHVFEVPYAYKSEYQFTPLDATLYTAIDMAVLFLIWYFVCYGSKHAIRTAAREEFTGEFAPVSLCECVKGKCATFFETVCCHPFLWAYTIAKKKFLPFPVALAIQVCFIIAAPLTYSLSGLALCAIRIHYRRKLKDSYQQGPTGFMDCCYHWCCTPCATQQEYQFVEMYEDVYGPLTCQTDDADEGDFA